MEELHLKSNSSFFYNECMNIVFLHIDTNPVITLKDINEYRRQGNVVFIVSNRNYSYVHSHYYQYGNGFLTDGGRYAQMGCCEVIVDDPLIKEEIDSILKVNKETIFFGNKKEYKSSKELEIKEKVYSYSNMKIDENKVENAKKEICNYFDISYQDTITIR